MYHFGFKRWISDLKALYDPKSAWNFEGEVEPSEIAHSIFLVLFCLVPAGLIAYYSLRFAQIEGGQPSWKPIAQLVATPVQVVIAGALMALFLYVGSHFNRVAKPFPIAFKAALRIMSIQPILQLFLIFSIGSVINLIIYGYFVAKAAELVYGVPKRNARVFYYAVYFSFAFIQLQALFRT